MGRRKVENLLHIFCMYLDPGHLPVKIKIKKLLVTLTEDQKKKKKSRIIANIVIA